MNENNVNPTRPSRRYNIIIIAMLCMLALITLAVSTLFRGFVGNYRQNIADESADHLIEINHQIKLYVEERIDSGWKVVESVANSIDTRARDDEESIYAFMTKERDIWELSNVIAYTENGYSIGANGAVGSNDASSEIVYRARKQGEYMTIVDSTITYTIPVFSELHLNGSKIVAFSIVQELETFIDNMNFPSFDGSAYIYLTQDNGAVISYLTHPSATNTYNITALFEGREIRCLSSATGSAQEMLASQEAEAHLLHDSSGDEYVVSVPIEARGVRLRSFYFVPEAIVNVTSNLFATSITYLSIAVIGLFSVGVLIAFILLYIARIKRFDNALVARDRMFDLLVNNTSNAFSLLSTQRETPLYTSSNTEAVTGFERIGVARSGEGFLLTTFPLARSESIERVNAELSVWDGKGEYISGYIPRETRSGKRYFALSLYPVDGNATEFICIAQDMTQTWEREETMKVALAMADSSNAAKTRFLANMSHDIRTPMNAIVNMTAFAIDSIGEPKKQREYLNTIRDSSDHLLHLINDILDMSRIEIGQTTMAREPFDLKECLSGVADIIRPLQEAKRQSLEADFSGIQTTGVLGDQVKLSQVLINLLNNAVKFTPEGGSIHFAVEDIPSLKSDIAVLRFSVRDDGIGIEEKFVERIFEPFVREENKRAISVEGTGLGLSICKSYVAAMGGTIVCQSVPGKGSTFTVELSFPKTNIEKQPKSRKKAGGEISFAGKRALLCEDNAINQTIALKILRKFGFEVDAARDGAEGARMFESSAPGTYDIVYMDIQMPVMDGYEATVAIRESGHPQAKSIPVVAMTANVFAEDVEKSRACGMNGHLGKPIMIQEFAEETSRILKIGGETK